jgi:hypothetical protein
MVVRMAVFMRVIPNQLYNSLLERGLLDNEDIYPASKVSPLDKLVNKLPEQLQSDAKDLLHKLTGLTWNENEEITYKGVECKGSSVSDLVVQWVLENPMITNLTGWKYFKAALIDNIPDSSFKFIAESKPQATDQFGGSAECLWVTFESMFKLKK